MRFKNLLLAVLLFFGASMAQQAHARLACGYDDYWAISEAGDCGAGTVTFCTVVAGGVSFGCSDGTVHTLGAGSGKVKAIGNVAHPFTPVAVPTTSQIGQTLLPKNQAPSQTPAKK